MNGGQRGAEAWQAGDIPSQDAGTQMSHETPGTCLWVGWENRWQRFWHGGAVMVWIVSQLLPADS